MLPSVLVEFGLYLSLRRFIRLSLRGRPHHKIWKPVIRISCQLPLGQSIWRIGDDLCWGCSPDSMRSGYHRDGFHHPQFSRFEAEMRGRILAMVVQLDQITSSQFRLPTTIQGEQTDVVETLELLDDVFNEKMMEQSTAQPDTEMTLMMYYVTRNQLSGCSGINSDMTTSIQSSSYTEVLRLDKLPHEIQPAIFASRRTTATIYETVDYRSS